MSSSSANSKSDHRSSNQQSISDHQVKQSNSRRFNRRSNQPINHSINHRIKSNSTNLINLLSDSNRPFLARTILCFRHPTATNEPHVRRVEQPDNVIHTTTQLVAPSTRLINLNYFNLFRFRSKLWLFLIIILLKFSLHSTQTINDPQQQNCLDLSQQIDTNSRSKYPCKNSTEIIIGYLTNYNSTSGQRLGLTDVGAIRLAISKANKERWLGDNRTLKMIIEDTQANPVRSTSAMLDQYTKGAVAFIGPDNTCVTEATLAAAINLPMISYKCSDQKVSDIENYKTFARTVPPDTGIVNSVLSLLEHYGWRQFSLIYKDKDNFRKIAENLIENATIGNNFTVEPRHRYQPDYSECCLTTVQPCCQLPFKRIVEDVSKQTRIWVFIGDRKEVQHFMTMFKNYNLHLNNHFVLIVDTTDWDNYINIRFLTEKMDTELKRAYRSSMMITLSPPNRTSYDSFVQEIKKNEEMNNVTTSSKSDDMTPFVTLYACYLYDAVKLYTRALKSIFEKRLYCANNGVKIIQELIGLRSYDSVCGSHMEIDKNGDVLGNYTVFAYRDAKDDLSNSSGLNPKYDKQFIPIGMFRYLKSEDNPNDNNPTDDNSTKTNNTLKYEPIGNLTVDWLFDSLPVSNPECGK